MERLKALEKLDRVVTTITEGSIPYDVLELAVYGSVVKEEEKVGDLDLYLQLDKDSVPGEDLLCEVSPWMGPGVEKKLRAALKEYPQERIQVSWGFDPWEKRRDSFVKVEDVDRQVDGEIDRLTWPEGEEPKSWREARARLERQREKVKAKDYEWPPHGIVVYKRGGKAERTIEDLLEGAAEDTRVS